MLWNLRSALNVAALNCSEPKHAEILPRYRSFLKNYNTALMVANRKIDAEFKARYGAKFTAPREAYMTSVYNHFALPPAMGEFCNAALAVTNDLAAITPVAPIAAAPKKGRAKAVAPRVVTLKPAELEAFAVRSLPSIEVVYDDFYRRYETYRNRSGGMEREVWLVVCDGDQRHALIQPGAGRAAFCAWQARPRWANGRAPGRMALCLKAGGYWERGRSSDGRARRSQ